MLNKILEHKITLAIAAAACVIAVGGAAYFLLSPQKRALTNATAQVMTIRQEVSADGKVDSDQHVSLSFPKDGRITAVNVNVGDHVYAGEALASMDSGQLSASLAGARADVASAEANLASLQKGATPQTRDVYLQNNATAKLALSTAVNDAYLKVQDALLNKIGILFQNNTSSNPTLTIQAESYQTGLDIDAARGDMTTRMLNWNSIIQDDPVSDQALSESSNDIGAAKSLLDALSHEVNRLNPGNSGANQSDITADVTAVNGAASEVNAAQTEFNSALQAYRTAIDQLNVIQASSTPEAVQVAQAALSKAQASVASIQSQIADTALIAPFDGTVASVNPRVGDNFSANTPAIDVISPGAYKIDVMVPENEITVVAVGDPASITFSGSGNSLTATGTVASVDLSETMTDGVGAYKATVRMNSSDPRIRTGMGANVTIAGPSKDNAVAIPASAVITKADGTYALVLDDSGSYVEQKVQTGISNGQWIEILSGIQAGETVAAFGDTGQ